eukprot:NODE_626_length_5881_cov_0.289519.p1 type:complete len:317 gc:universal NODE_626_length_5881_cov_0.289519:1120-170(-)
MPLMFGKVRNCIFSLTNVAAIGAYAINEKEMLGLPSTSIVVQKAGFVAEVDYLRKVPLWVLEHYTSNSLGKSEEVSRKDVPFTKDENVPTLFQATNQDYHKSGFSRGHMSPAAANKLSQEHMNDTFSLSNIIPQDFDNNKNYWAQLESWSRNLIHSNAFEQVWILSGPCWMPISFDKLHLSTIINGSPLNTLNYDHLTPIKDDITIPLIGKQKVAVPSHLYKVVVCKLPSSSVNLPNQSHFPDFMVAAFLIPNKPIPADIPLHHFEVPLVFLEKYTGIHMFPKLDRSNLGLLCTSQLIVKNKSVPMCYIRPNKQNK